MEDTDPFLHEIMPEDSGLAQVPVSGSSNVPTVPNGSPRWGASTKLVVGLSVVAISAFLFVRFLNIVGPLLLAFILAYLIYPLAEQARVTTRLPWRVVVSFLFLFLVLLLFGLIAVGGLAVIDQLQALIRFLQNAVVGLPEFIDSIASQPIEIGPFTINTEVLDSNAIAQQLLGVIQPILSQAGSSIVSFASGTATVFGWMFFILFVSYFITSESGGFPNRLFSLSIPGHEEDIRRLGMALNRIWEAFLRGQITIVLLTITIYSIFLGSLGVRFFFGLALLAGLARFVPYVGPFVAWTTYGLVTFFQGSTVFGLSPLGYVLLIVGGAWVLDLFLDNYVMPRMMSNALRVHPAAVMIFALVALNLLGVVGVVLSAPVLATVKLFFDYIFAKLFDLDPWSRMETISPPNPLPPVVPLLRNRYSRIRERIDKMVFPKPK